MMNTNCFKYLTIPIIATLLYVALALTEKLYALYLHDILITDPFARLIIWNSVIRIVLFSLVIFVPMLIFTSAYELTKLNFKTIIYAVFISIALFIFNIINHFFTSYVREVLNTYYDISYYHLVNFFSYYSMLYTLLTILVILGITLIYARLNKHSLTPITNKNIGLRYAGLFITLTLVESLQNINTVSILTEIPWKILFYFISITLASFVFYFAYCYLWTKEALHVNKITTNYAAKLVGSCLFTLFMLISICFALYMGILKLPQLLRQCKQSQGINTSTLYCKLPVFFRFIFYTALSSTLIRL